MNTTRRGKDLPSLFPSFRGLLGIKEAGLRGQLACSKGFSGTRAKGQKGTSERLQAPI